LGRHCISTKSSIRPSFFKREWNEWAGQLTHLDSSGSPGADATSAAHKACSAYFPSGLLEEFDMLTGIHLGVGSLISEHALVPFGTCPNDYQLIDKKGVCSPIVRLLLCLISHI
jgi:hypothetical protein